MELQKQLKGAEEALARKAAASNDGTGRKLLKEEVTESDIAEIISKWTGEGRGQLGVGVWGVWGGRAGGGEGQRGRDGVGANGRTFEIPVQSPPAPFLSRAARTARPPAPPPLLVSSARPPFPSSSLAPSDPLPPSLHRPAPPRAPAALPPPPNTRLPGIPISKLVESEREKLLHLTDELHR